MQYPYPGPARHHRCHMHVECRVEARLKQVQIIYFHQGPRQLLPNHFFYARSVWMLDVLRDQHNESSHEYTVMFKGIKASSEPCCLPDYHVQLLFIYQLILQCLVFLHVYIVGISVWVHLGAYMLLCVYFWIVGMLTFSQYWLLCSFPCDFLFLTTGLLCLDLAFPVPTWPHLLVHDSL